MTTLIDYKGLQVLDPDPTGDGGRAIQNDFKLLADRIAASRHVSGLRLAFSNTTSVTIEPGNAISDDGTSDITVASALTARLTTSGANGLDSGSPAASRVYFVHVIADSSDNPQAVAGLLSLNEQPSLPAGYDQFRRIGFFATDGSGDIVRFHQAWAGLTRRYFYAENQDRSEVLGSGHATNFQAVDLSMLVPRTARSIILAASFLDNAPTGVASDRAAMLRAHGDINNGTLLTISGGIGSSFPLTQQINVACSSDQQVDYRVSHPAADLKLSIIGVDDEL